MCLNFPDSAAPAVSLGRAADWLHDDVGYSSGSSAGSSGPTGQNPLLCFLCDAGESPVGLSVDVTAPHADSTPSIPVIQMLSASDRMFPECSSDMTWLVSNNDCITNIPSSLSPLCIMTHAADVNGDTNHEDPCERLVFYTCYF